MNMVGVPCEKWQIVNFLFAFGDGWFYIPIAVIIHVVCLLLTLIV